MIAAALAAIWVPDIVVAQQARQRYGNASGDTIDLDKGYQFRPYYDKALSDIDEKIGDLQKFRELNEGVKDAVMRHESRLVELEKAAEELRRLGAVLEFIKWEATVFMGGFGIFLVWIVKWIINKSNEFSKEIQSVRRDARIGRHDDFQLMGPPLARMLEDKYPEMAEAIRSAIYRRQDQESRRAAEDPPSGERPTFKP